MNSPTLVLDKQFSSEMEDDLGKIGIRVVVFHKKQKSKSDAVEDQPLDLEEAEDFSTADSEVNSYLELPKRGKLCCVFLINGQRHHGLDNSFIVNQLRMKYLRKRMIVIVDLDGLSEKASAEIMQGSRSGLYEGQAYHKINERLVSTLQRDPDLLELEEEAEEELSQLQVGDAAVQEALDQLIDNHFEGSDHTAEGAGDAAGKSGFSVSDDGKKVQLEVIKSALEGAPASSPVLLCSHQGTSYRLRPNVKGKLFVAVDPKSEWKHLTDIVALVEPSTAGFSFTLHRKADHAFVDMEFVEPNGFDKDEYPIELTLSVLATFKNQADLRLTDKQVVIRPPKTSPPPPPAQLSDEPSFIRVASRQPIRLIAGGAAVHVRMRWDGKDHLTSDASPSWAFQGLCTSHEGISPLTFTQPVNGRFEALVFTSSELLIGTKLKFEIMASGPGGVVLSTELNAEIIELPSPRKVKASIPTHGQRRPPYKVVIVKEEQFSSSTRWGEEQWDATHAGAFIEPKPDAPLTLCINQDLALLKNYLDSLVAKKADEQRTEEKKTKYISHIAYHLYQMYLHKEKVQKEKETDSEVVEPKDEDMQEEINRVSSTLIRLMEVSR